MTMQILVPLDGSPFSEQALESACEIAQRLRADLHLVRVHENAGTHAAEFGSAYDDTIHHELWRAASEYIGAQAVQASRTFGLITHSATLSGPVPEAIAAYVRRARISLVVMASHGRTGFGRVLLGNVAEALSRTLTVPMLLLRPHKGANGPVVHFLRPRRILIPLDGSGFAEQVIESAVEVGWPVGAEYALVHVIAPPIPETYATAVATQMDNYELLHMRDQAETYLEGVAARLRKVGLRVETIVVTHADAAAAIIQEAVDWEADLIAMATHGRSGWKRFALGSIAQQVLHSAYLPLLLLKGSSSAVKETVLPEDSCAV